MQIQPADNSLVFSYLSLRRVIGILGFTLPFLLALGGWAIFDTGLQRSMSAYYHTGMGDVFVGILFALGFFLLSYKGYERRDDLVGDLGFVFALGVALFPTTPTGTHGGTDLIGYIHLACAGLFFGTLIYFALFLFTKSAPDQPVTRKKRHRNLVYRTCGYAMLLCILLIGVYNIADGDESSLARINPVFWLEAIAVAAFGISWLIKGEAILKDETS